MFSSFYVGSVLYVCGGYLPPPPSDEDSVMLWKLDYPAGQEGKCAQYESPAELAFFPITFGGFAEGVCADQGYTVPAGTETATEPVIGEVEYDMFAPGKVKKVANTSGSAGFLPTIESLDTKSMPV